MLRILTFSAPKLIFPQIRSPINRYCSLSENRELVVSFLKANGLTDDHITRLSRTRPQIFNADPQKTLAPKFDFFLSLGISNTDIVKIISSNPFLLHASLKNQIIPCHRYLKSLLHTDENVIKVIKRRCMILCCSIDKILAPKINLLSEIGVPESGIQYMLLRRTSAFQTTCTVFKSKVEEVVSLGFDPMKLAFLDAVSLLCVCNKATIDRKWAAFRKVNISDDDIRVAFRSYPNCMIFSEEKITRVLDFLVNKMGFETSKIVASPAIITYDLEKRIIPRCRVIKVLQSHGFLKKDIAFSTFLSSSEMIFLEKFVSKYEDKVPGLLKIYTEKNRNFSSKDLSDHLETGTGSDCSESSMVNPIMQSVSLSKSLL